MAGTVSATLIAPWQGGTGQDTSAWDGLVEITSGVWGTTTASGGSAGLFTTTTWGAYYNDGDMVLGHTNTSSAPFWLTTLLTF